MFVKNKDIPKEIYWLIAGKVSSPGGGSFDSFQILMRLARNSNQEHSAKIQAHLVKVISGSDTYSDVEFIRNIDIIKKVQDILDAESKKFLDKQRKLNDFPVMREIEELSLLYGYVANCPVGVGELMQHPLFITELIERNALNIPFDSISEYVACV